MGEAGEIAHDGACGVGIDLDAATAVLARIVEGLLADKGGQRLDVRQGHLETRRQRLQVVGQFELRADQHQGVLDRCLAQDDFAHQAQGHRIAQVGLEIEQQEHCRLGALLDRGQRQGRIGNGAFALVVHVDAAQALGDAPGEQRAQRLRNGVPETVDDAAFLDRFNDQQRRARAQQGGEILIDAH